VSSTGFGRIGPAQLFPPDKHENIDAILGEMNFAKEVYGLERQPGSGVDMDMKEVTRTVASGSPIIATTALHVGVATQDTMTAGRPGGPTHSEGE
jgi:hypothetical protein